MADPLAIEPLAHPPDAAVTVPGSKSITNRALVCAALASGDSTIEGALVADDTAAMAECLAGLGAAIVADGVDVRVTGLGGELAVADASLDTRLSGTTARFILPVLVLGRGRYRLDGAAPLRSRPMGPLLEALRALGAQVVEEGDPGRLPVTVAGPVEGGPTEIAGDVSSQFLSGLLLAGPCLRRGIEVVPTTPLVSRPYLELTAAVMRSFGARVTGLRSATGGYRGSQYQVEADASSASYLFAAAAITGGRVAVRGLHRSSLQGDVRFVDLLSEMGAMVSDEREGLTVRGTGSLKGITVDLVDLPDMAQTLAAVAVFAESPTTVTGVGVIRGHETDRIDAVVRELGRCGIEAEERPDGFVVHPGRPQPAEVQTYDDHRMAMSFALLGLAAPGIRIADPDCVAKTFPGYWDALAQLRH